MGNEDLAKHHESMGDLHQAYDVYSKMRADASSSKHVIETGLHLARVSVLRRDWSMVITNVNKMSSLYIETGDKNAQAVANVNYGIGLLGQGKYAEAAQAFTRIDSSVPASAYDEFASPNDIATYGGLLSLATLDRPGLSNFLENSTFRTFLELEPQFRRAVSQFVNGRYSACLAILDSYRSDYLLDIYLQPHVPELYRMIRAKCIFHFLQPFSCVTVDSMNAAFAPPGESIMPEIINMIQNGGLQARIDPIERVCIHHHLCACLLHSSLTLTRSSPLPRATPELRCRPWLWLLPSSTRRMPSIASGALPSSLPIWRSRARRTDQTPKMELPLGEEATTTCQATKDQLSLHLNTEIFFAFVNNTRWLLRRFGVGFASGGYEHLHGLESFLE